MIYSEKNKNTLKLWLGTFFFFIFPFYFTKTTYQVVNLYKTLFLLCLFLVFFEDFSWKENSKEKIILILLTLLNLFFSVNKARTIFFIITGMVPALLILSFKWKKNISYLQSWLFSFWLGSFFMMLTFEYRIFYKKFFWIFYGISKNMYASNLVMAYLLIYFWRDIFPECFLVVIYLLTLITLALGNVFAAFLVLVVLSFVWLLVFFKNKYLKLGIILLSTILSSYLYHLKRTYFFRKIGIRMEIYSRFWKLFWEKVNFFFGRGFHNYIPPIVYSSKWSIRHFHNFFLNTLVTGGVVGLFLLLYFIYSFFKFFALPQKITFIVFFVLLMLSDSLFYYPVDFAIFVFFLFNLKLSSQHKNKAI